MTFILNAFEVYTPEYDDRGIDFVVRGRQGKFYSVQVKTTDPASNPFIIKSKFIDSEDFVFLAVRLVEGADPEIYLANATEWKQSNGFLHFNPEGGNTGPYYEMRFARKYEKERLLFSFESYAPKLL